MKKRIIGIIFLLLLLSGGITLCVVRWEAWFANPAEPVYSVPAGPTNVVLTFGEDASSQRVVSWRGGQDTTALSRLILQDLQTGLTDTLPAQTTLVKSRSGEAVFCQVKFDSLHPGTYAYAVETGGFRLSDMQFDVRDYNTCPRDTFLLFGDMQYTSLEEATAFISRAFQTVPEADFIAYVGDIIERPTDEYWQLYFQSMGALTAFLPQVAALGNHEYLKGVPKKFDARWPYIFVNPANGPERFCGRSYYINFPHLRLIVLDTDALQRPSDYTVLRTWLTHVLRYEELAWKATDKPNERWNIVLMHHPVYSAGMGRDNPTVAWALRYALQDADLVVAGHDHNYARHRHRGEAPAYVILSSSAKSYLPKCSFIEERLGSNHAFFSRVAVGADTMRMQTYLIDDTLPAPLLYDELTFVKDSPVVALDSLPAERLELPARYEGRNNVQVRRFLNRRNARLEHQD